MTAPSSVKGINTKELPVSESTLDPACRAVTVSRRAEERSMIADRLLLALLIIKITKMMMTCRIARAMHVDTVTALMEIAFLTDSCLHFLVAQFFDLVNL